MPPHVESPRAPQHGHLSLLGSLLFLCCLAYLPSGPPRPSTWGSEGELISLVESTDDLICSRDVDCRIGREPVGGKHFYASSSPERQVLWKQRFAQTAVGQTLRFEEAYHLNGERVPLDTGALEELDVPQPINEALRLHAISFERLGILVERDYGNVPSILIDRHKLPQILIHLLSDARHALVESQSQEKRSRMFTQGFTTKKTGHGFGLHISALAATEMKDRLTCSSPGPGRGATFTLELPLSDEEISS